MMTHVGWPIKFIHTINLLVYHVLMWYVCSVLLAKKTKLLHISREFSTTFLLICWLSSSRTRKNNGMENFMEPIFFTITLSVKLSDRRQGTWEFSRRLVSTRRWHNLGLTRAATKKRNLYLCEDNRASNTWETSGIECTCAEYLRLIRKDFVLSFKWQ